MSSKARTRQLLTALAVATASTLASSALARAKDGHWVGTWASSPQLADTAQAAPAAGFADTTLRQVVHVSIGGTRLRVRFSNAFGKKALTIDAAQIARSAGADAIETATDRAITFGGRASVTISAGALIVSDALDFDLPPLSDVTLTTCFKAAVEDITTHPGSRTTSYLQTGNMVSAPALPDARRVDFWYFINGIDVETDGSAAAVSVLGDSITDGRGSTTNKNNRWPDELARRLQANRATAHVAVLNAGIGGNRLLRDGLGPNALARLDRDVLAQTGVRWLIVLEGINDLGTRPGAAARGEPVATAQDVIAAYEQIIVRGHSHGIRVYGGTIMACEGSGYFNPELEADRQTINDWIRTSGKFDGVIDFDLATRDPQHPTRLLEAADSGDHLHPGVAGHKMLGAAVDLRLFTR